VKERERGRERQGGGRGKENGKNANWGILGE